MNIYNLTVNGSRASGREMLSIRSISATPDGRVILDVAYGNWPDKNKPTNHVSNYARRIVLDKSDVAAILEAVNRTSSAISA